MKMFEYKNYTFSANSRTSALKILIDLGYKKINPKNIIQI